MKRLMTKISYEVLIVAALVASVATVAATWLHAFGHYGQ
jgi:hypothetical protein